MIGEEDDPHCHWRLWSEIWYNLIRRNASWTTSVMELQDKTRLLYGDAVTMNQSQPATWWMIWRGWSETIMHREPIRSDTQISAYLYWNEILKERGHLPSCHRLCRELEPPCECRSCECRLTCKCREWLNWYSDNQNEGLEMVQLDLYYIPRPHIIGGSKLNKIALVEMVEWLAPKIICTTERDRQVKQWNNQAPRNM